MELGSGFSTIVSCPVAGRNVLLFYNINTGAMVIASLYGKATLTVLHKYTFSPGWTHVVWSNGRVLFYNEYNGVAAIGSINPRGWVFTQTAVLPGNVLGPGWVDILSAGNHLWFHRLQEGWDLIARLTSTAVVAESRTWHWEEGRVIMVAERDIVAGYSVDYRKRASISFVRIGYDGGFYGLYPWSETDPDWSTILLSNGFILYYDDGVGGGKIIDPDGYRYWIDDLPSTPANIGTAWTHLVAVGIYILFYAEYNGTAATGSIGPGGEFSGETKLTIE